jgi:energy-converting hydrogenase Eha subunit E
MSRILIVLAFVVYLALVAFCAAGGFHHSLMMFGIIK